ncbi:site-specific integrase [Vibrio cyclitrophicus]|uniref:site-specific integrase n=1 Tax=Vibrio cyclitrophicus TaxID=47951 RepID=UPI00148BEF3E|nr:site-specific integrase [Vibrio cyclitrophicus]NOH44474.1 site-specific integrase [Vibrio cyclitrophicus]
MPTECRGSEEFSYGITIADSDVQASLFEQKNKTLPKLTKCLDKVQGSAELQQSQSLRLTLQDESQQLESIRVIESIWDRKDTPAEKADRYLELIPFTVSDFETHYYENMRSNLVAIYQLTRNFQRYLDVLDFDGAKGVLESIESYDGQASINFRLQLVAKSSKIHSEELVVELEDVLKSFEMEKANKSKGLKEVKAICASCRLVHDLLGTTNMASVDRDGVNRIIPDLKNYVAHARGFTNKKLLDGLNARQILELNKKLQLPLRKEEQALRDIERASTLYRWAVTHNKIDYNPFEGLCNSKSIVQQTLSLEGLKDEKSKKAPFSTIDLKAIFKHPVYTEGRIGVNKRDQLRLNYQYWVMLIALTTGARPNEICQLRVRDVPSIDGVLCFLVQAVDDDQSLKNKNAVRVIPVPEALLNLGFRSYLDSVSRERMLFPELTYTRKSRYYGKVESWFARTFSKPMKLSSVSKSFYSFRHHFIFDYQKRSERCSMVAQLVGHENGNVTDDIYGGRFPISLLKDKIDELQVEHLLKDVRPFIL